MKFLNFFKFLGHFSLPVSDPADQNQCGSGSTTLSLRSVVDSNSKIPYRTKGNGEHSTLQNMNRFFSFLDDHFGLPGFASRFRIPGPVGSGFEILYRIFQGCGSGSGWTRIIFESYSRIRFRVKSWMQVRFIVKIQKLETQNRAVEGIGRSRWRPGGSKWSPEGSVDQWSQIPFTLKKSRIRIRINVKSFFRIRIKVMRILLIFFVFKGYTTLDFLVASRHDDYELKARIIHCPGESNGSL